VAKKRKRQRNLKLMVAKWLRELQWFVADVEVRHGIITRDLFGVADLMAMDNKFTNLIQVTSKDHRWSHRKTILAWLATDEGKAWKSCEDRGVYLVWVDKDNHITTEVL
jgi:hypothetical protein